MDLSWDGEETSTIAGGDDLAMEVGNPHRRHKLKSWRRIH
jgi:hypothetical protein